MNNTSLTNSSSTNASNSTVTYDSYFQTLINPFFGSSSNVSLVTASLTNSSSTNANISSNSAYSKNSPDPKVTFVSYLQTLLEPRFVNLQGTAIFVCLLFHWILLSLIFGMLPISYGLRKISKDKIFISIATNVLFYCILILGVYLQLICSPCKMYLHD